MSRVKIQQVKQSLDEHQSSRIPPVKFVPEQFLTRSLLPRDRYWFYSPASDSKASLRRAIGNGVDATDLASHYSLKVDIIHPRSCVRSKEDKGENMNENRSCPIWDTPAKLLSFATIGDELWNVDSFRAGGKYRINVVGRAATEISKLDDRTKARLTTWLIKQRRLGDECPEIRSYEIESIIQRPPLSVHARADELLKYIQEGTPHIGEKSLVPNRGDPSDESLAGFLAYTESIELKEVQYLLNYLIGQGWLKSDTPTLNVTKVVITVEGYGRLAELETKFTASSRAFVAMWFDGKDVIFTCRRDAIDQIHFDTANTLT